MRHEVRNIPPAPRRLRLRPLLAHRWPLWALGAIPTVIGVLVAWAMFLQSGGKFSLGPTLDRGPVDTATAVVRRVGPPVEIDGRRREEVVYELRWGPQQIRLGGSCFMPAGSCRVGDERTAEVLAADVNLHRLVGSVLHIDRDWLRAKFWLLVLVLPGGLLLLAWLTSMLQLRRVLVHGDVSPGLVHRVTEVPHVLPEMLRVDYTFRDHHATLRHNRHWVRRHGELGARLLEQMASGRYEEMPVLYDRRQPNWNRMLLPQDFLRTAPIELAAPGAAPGSDTGSDTGSGP
jgi:hypothetical protein